MFFRAIVLGLALLTAFPAGARCLSDRETRRAVARGDVLAPGDMMGVARSWGGDLISARLCEGSGGLVYRVAVINADGRVARLVVDAQSGQILSGN
jgi:hypothetical protein